MKLGRVALLALLGLVIFASVTPSFADEDEAAEDEAAEEVAEEAEEEEDELPEDDEDVHPLTDMPLASPDVLTAGVFPNENPGKLRFGIGKQVDALVGIVNNGQEAINVTAIMGSLNSPFDFNYYIQNFTDFTYNTIVQEEEEASFHYRFQTASNLDPVDYQVALTIFYENDDELFSHTFFNGSVSFYEDSALVDVEALFKKVGGFAAVAALFYIFTTIAAGSGGEVDTGSNGNGNGQAKTHNDDWTADTYKGRTSTASRTNAKKRRGSGKKR